MGKRRRRTSTTTRPLNARRARDAIRKALDSPSGRVSYTSHAERRFRERKLEMTDVVNVLRAGAVQEPEDEGGGCWTYHILTARLCVVVELVFPGKDVTVVRVRTARRL